jgi:hypothetical protein
MDGDNCADRSAADQPLPEAPPPPCAAPVEAAVIELSDALAGMMTCQVKPCSPM